MDSHFIYSKYVTGKNFVGRKQQVQFLTNLFAQSENVTIYEPHNTGKTSLIQQTFFTMKTVHQKFEAVEVSLLNIRTIADLMIRMGSAVLKNAGTTYSDYARTVQKYLGGTHFIFDERNFEAKGLVLSLNWDIDDEDIRAVLSLPYRLAYDRGMKTYLILDEFQNVMLTEDGDRVCRILEGVFKQIPPEMRKLVSFVFCGSEVNAMKEIFEHKRWFYRQVERVKLEPIDTKDIIDYTIKGFLTSGKVLDRDLLLGICSLFRNNIWYINHFASICDSMSKGYIMEPVLLESLEVLVSIHKPRFTEIMNGLTTFQICLLRAVLDGHTKFSSSDVIQRYNLNSSANVRRLKDALCKKEIITFDENDIPEILDPLFEYWVKKYFFEIGVE